MKLHLKLWMIAVIGVLFVGALFLLQGLVAERETYYPVTYVKELGDYRLLTRSVKYGLLFLLLTYGVFALFETFKGLNIHPMQYLLVGAALAIFYLLLLAFTEHVGFRLAYQIAFVACVGLITMYVSYVLHSKARALLLGGLLSFGYQVLFVLLQTKVYTLLAGSILLFMSLAAVMFFTRNVDWYALSEAAEQDVALADEKDWSADDRYLIE